MKVMRTPGKITGKYLRYGKTEDKVYRMMRYVLRSDHEAVRLLNLITGEAVELDKEEAELIAALPAAHAPWMDELIRRYFLVAEDFDERDWVDCLRAIAGNVLGLKSEGPCYVIMPTSACNAGCWYCFEEGIPRLTMTEETADRTAEYIAKTCGGKPVSISWYGGEPLLRPDIINRICDKLKKYGVSWTSLIITNAYLFDSEMISRAKKRWHLTRALITLDGDEDTYNKIKSFVTRYSAADSSPYSNTYSSQCGNSHSNTCSNQYSSPYRQVLENIEELLKEGIKVQVRLNLGDENYDPLVSMLHENAPMFSKYDNCTISVALIREGCHIRTEDIVCQSDGAKDMLPFRRAQLISLAGELGLRTAGPYSHMRINGCIAERDGHVVINPQGELYKCYQKTFDGSAGSVYDNAPAIPGSCNKKLQLKECGTCVLYPDCYRSSVCRDTCSSQEKDSRINQLITELENCVLTEYKN